jgi:serine/threonine protein kinase
MAAAGAGGGIFSAAAADNFLDCTAEVRGFMTMLGLNELNHEYQPTVAQFMQFMENPRSNAVLNAVKDQIKIFKNPIVISTGKRLYQPLMREGGEIVAGSFGQIWASNSSDRIIWKMVPEYKHGQPLLPMILQECFVQFIVSQKFPDFAIKLLDIRKQVDRATGTIHYFICMERADDDLFGYIERIASATNTLSDEYFYSILRTILVNLIKCNKGLGFVHRDMKSDNFVFIRGGTGIEIKMIDFGMSCLTVKADGKVYNVKSSAPKYQPDVPCMPQQDMLLFIYEFLTVYGSLRFGSRALAFFETVLAPGLRSAMESRMQRYKNHYAARGREIQDRELLLSAYNTHGTLTVPGGVAHYLTPEYVYNILESVFFGGAGAGAGGGAGAGAGGGAAAGLKRQRSPNLPASALPSAFASPPRTPVKAAHPAAAAVPLFATSAAPQPLGFGTPTRRGGKRSLRKKSKTKRHR